MGHDPYDIIQDVSSCCFQFIIFLDISTAHTKDCRVVEKSLESFHRKAFHLIGWYPG